ncbi:MAG: DEAD/DEAH box helicase [Candidatus Omnitrophica bacterium]|nr:DEAD/DEAH box helicase [Candidatus Omnitrophota bacterium]
MSNLSHTNEQNNASFYGLGIAPRILEILESLKFKSPTPIQFQAIPLAIEGKDVVGIAQTGTGKTHSFAIPMVQCLAGKKGIGLVLAPTRELAMQIDEVFQLIVPSFKMEAVCLIGGAPMDPQVKALRRNPRIIIATPGRLIDHMSNWNVLPQEVEMLVLDEADRMLDMGFLPQIELILQHLPKERQTMLFSATMPKEIVGIAAKYMQLPVSVEIAPAGTTADNVTQELYIVKKSAKMDLLRKVLSKYHGPVLLFSRTKHNATRLVRSIRGMGHRAAEIHSDRSLDQRVEALEGFKSGQYKVLVATDIASRGIDVTGIELVINYDIPDDASNYVHRIGRTGRAGHKGHAISFAMPEQKRDVEDIEKLIKATLPISKHPKIQSESFIMETPGNFPPKKKPRRPSPSSPRQKK